MRAMSVERHDGIVVARRVMKFRTEDDARLCMHQLVAKGAEELSDFETRAMGGRKFTLCGDVYYLFIQ